MDYYFMRTDTGYDVIMLAVENKRGMFRVYQVQSEKTEGAYLFEESDPGKLRKHVRAWCREHLPDDMEMICFSVKNGRDPFLKIKDYLLDRHIPFEMKQHTFYVRKKEYDGVKNDLQQLANH